MSLAGKTLNPRDRVRHPRFGTGTIRLDEGETAVVRLAGELQGFEKPGETNPTSTNEKEDDEDGPPRGWFQRVHSS